MINLLLLRKICIALILLIVGYHFIFGTARFLIDFGCPGMWYDNTVVVFGSKLRTGIFRETSPQASDMWAMDDIQPERQSSSRSGYIGTILDKNVYDYEVEMGWFYQYKNLYVYGRNGFWVIQADPFHIKLWRSENIPEEDARRLDKTIAKYTIYGDQFTVVHSESDLTRDEKKAYVRVKEKAQPRIETLKAQGLYP